MSSFIDKFESHEEKLDLALEKVVVTAVTVFLAEGVLFIDLSTKLHYILFLKKFI